MRLNGLSEGLTSPFKRSRILRSLSPDTAESKLQRLIGDKDLRILERLKGEVNPSDRPLSLIYYSAGSDVKTPIAATGATSMTFVDRLDKTAQIKAGVAEIGGKINCRSRAQNRTEVSYSWNGKGRTLIFYEWELNDGDAGKLPEEVACSDVFFARLSVNNGVGSKIYSRTLASLKIGG